MKEGAVPGLSHERTWVVEPDMGIRHFGAGVPSVLSSPTMIALMERTCVELLNPYMGEGEQTVGFHVDVKHLAPTRIGQSITVRARLEEVKEERFRFSVEASNDGGVKIGSGIHRRALIRMKEFTSGKQ